MTWQSFEMTEGGPALIDTSAWIEYFRPEGDPEITRRVDIALASDQACVCEMVLLELRRGGGEGQRKAVNQLAESVRLCPIDGEVWNLAYRLADRTRTARTPVPNTDLVISACAHRYGLALVHRDRHFDVLESLLI